MFRYLLLGAVYAWGYMVGTHDGYKRGCQHGRAVGFTVGAHMALDSLKSKLREQGFDLIVDTPGTTE